MITRPSVESRGPYAPKEAYMLHLPKPVSLREATHSIWRHIETSHPEYDLRVEYNVWLPQWGFGKELIRPSKSDRYHVEFTDLNEAKPRSTLLTVTFEYNISFTLPALLAGILASRAPRPHQVFGKTVKISSHHISLEAEVEKTERELAA